MSLKTKIPARLKALFAGVALSKKSIDGITEKASVGLTDESTDDEIDAVLNARNEIWSFDDQRKYDDYQAGKATKDAADKEAARLKAIADGKPAPIEVDPNETATEKALRLIMEKLEKQDAVIAQFGQEKVATTLYGAAETRLKSKYADYPEILADVLLDVKERSFQDEETLNAFLDRKEAALGIVIQTSTNNSLGGERPVGGAGGKPAGSTKEASAAEVDAAFTNFKI
ncbi:hypothetical protein [Pedobacter nyackensis]|uniref:Uncharacterized protein n=1 Tax=Pedobacter nyackensis TaxID=475255 RepID=A0A1W1ZXS8_9SPHI|nr:hypothetical protein [Pedobacter nyackensis]SMC53166.1 hypothetical protein SAMN04488101_101134 [Pedobacter nyackensis]